MFADTLDVDEAADTLRFIPIPPDATSIYDLGTDGDGDVTTYQAELVDRYSSIHENEVPAELPSRQRSL
jgi:hypothetical protein